MSSKAQNVKKALGNGRTRLVFFGGIALIVFMMVIAWFVFARKTGQAEKELASAVSAPPPLQQKKTAGPPEQATPVYDELLAENNAKVAEEALKTGGSAIPTPRTGVKESTTEVSPRPIRVGATPAPETASTQQRNEQERQAYEQAVQARITAFKGQMDKLEKYWTVQAHDSIRIAPEPTGQRQQTQQGGMGQSSISTGGNTTGNAGSVPAAASDIRAGDMKYATLDVGINTDDAASKEVMATIHEAGRFKDARLFGQIQAGGQYSKTVGLHFTRMLVVGETKERTIDAWAVNPDTQRPAVASDVNNHYMSRAASTFIGAFLDAYSDALVKGGQTQSVTSTSSSTTSTTEAYTTKQLVQIGAGKAGSKISDVFNQSSNRPKTIRVNAGIDMGVWFLQNSGPNTGNEGTSGSAPTVSAPLPTAASAQ